MKKIWKSIKDWFVADFPYGEACWHCNSACDPAYCRSIGLKIDKEVAHDAGAGK